MEAEKNGIEFPIDRFDLLEDVYILDSESPVRRKGRSNSLLYVEVSLNSIAIYL